MQDQIIADSKTYDTAGRRQGASDTAVAGVEQAFGSAQDANARAQRRTGSSSGGRSAALMADFAISKAKASAGASTTAMNNVEQQGYARKMDAVGLGSGIIGNLATMQNLANTSGAAGVSAAGAGLAATNSGESLILIKPERPPRRDNSRTMTAIPRTQP